jgi:tetratricopeptide (TPR) repeat protein
MQSYYYLGSLYARQARQASDEPSKADDRERHDLAVKTLRSALDWGAKTRQGLDYHYLYYQFALIYRELARLEPDRGYEQQRLRALEQSIAYCPAFTQPMYELAEAWYASGQADLPTIASLRRRIYRQTPDVFDKYYVSAAYRMLTEGLYEKAAQAWEQILMIDPANPLWQAKTIDCHLLTGEVVRARALLDRFRREDPQGYSCTGAILTDALLNRDWTKALTYLVHIVSEEPVLRAAYRAIELETRRREGKGVDRVWFTRPAGFSESEWVRLVADQRPAVLRVAFQEPQAARRAFEERLAMGGTPPLEFWLAGARIGMALGDEALARRALQGARALKPDDAAVAELEKRLAATFHRQTD